MRFLPVFLDTAAGVVVVLGSGEPALGKLRLLRAAGAHVRWFSRNADVAEEMLPPSAQGRLEISFGDPLKVDLSNALAVVSAAGEALDAQIAARARRHRIPVNVVDRPELSTFIFPAIVDRGEVVVAVGTGGASPVVARRVRERIEAMLPARIGDLAAFIGRWRKQIHGRIPEFPLRRRFWERVVDGPIGALVFAGAQASGQAEGRVTLVGAGPGDPDLLTIKALRALQDADVVFYDELVPPEILDRIRRDASRI